MPGSALKTLGVLTLLDRYDYHSFIQVKKQSIGGLNISPDNRVKTPN